MAEHNQSFFSDKVSEKLFESLVALAAEVHVLRDRVAHLEALNGMPATGDRDPAIQSRDYVQHVFGNLARP